MARFGWLAALCGCAADVDRFLVVSGRDGDYALAEVEIPELTDPARMHGSLGDGSVGGYVNVSVDAGQDDLEGAAYRGGGPITVRFSESDGVGIPRTDDGLVLWSYYHTLSALRSELSALGIDVEPIFPVDFAYQPHVGGPLFTVTNAAYAGSGIHLFALLADTRRSPLPLAANPGVIRHEFGHAIFQLLTAGSVHEVAPAYDSTKMRALNEGFADMVATLTLDDPGFLSLSLPIPERNVDGEASIATSVRVDDDPYSRGTVYASLAWDLRELTDPDTAMLLSIEALRIFVDGQPWQDDDVTLQEIDRWAETLVEVASQHDPALLAPMCADYERRFASAPEICL